MDTCPFFHAPLHSFVTVPHKTSTKVITLTELFVVGAVLVVYLFGGNVLRRIVASLHAGVLLLVTSIAVFDPTSIVKTNVSGMHHDKRHIKEGDLEYAFDIHF
mmetsp:Transcript_35432/g.52884  ORF Transcript_35432/g.52884 Transcript_35432/m.52884 type:complete len:103 (+) Transcript_35432:2272-2580(+)